MDTSRSTKKRKTSRLKQKRLQSGGQAGTSPGQTQHQATTGAPDPQTGVTPSIQEEEPDQPQIDAGQHIKQTNHII